LALTDSGSVVVARQVGPAGTAIAGTLLGDSAGSFLVAVRQVRRREGDAVSWRGERLSVPHALVASVNERRLSRTRTTLASVGAVAGVLLARAALQGL